MSVDRASLLSLSLLEVSTLVVAILTEKGDGGVKLVVTDSILSVFYGPSSRNGQTEPLYTQKLPRRNIKKD